MEPTSNKNDSTAAAVDIRTLIDLSTLTREDLMGLYASCQCADNGPRCKWCQSWFAELFYRWQAIAPQERETYLCSSMDCDGRMRVVKRYVRRAHDMCSWLEQDNLTRRQIKQYGLSAKEIVQDTWARIYDNPKPFLRPTKGKRRRTFKSWFFGQARNEVARAVRFYENGGIVCLSKKYKVRPRGEIDCSLGDRFGPGGNRYRTAPRNKKFDDGTFSPREEYRDDFGDGDGLAVQDRVALRGDYRPRVRKRDRAANGSLSTKYEPDLVKRAISFITATPDEKLGAAFRLFLDGKTWTAAAKAVGLPLTTLLSQRNKRLGEAWAHFQDDISGKSLRKVAGRRTRPPDFFPSLEYQGFDCDGKIQCHIITPEEDARDRLRRIDNLSPAIMQRVPEDPNDPGSRLTWHVSELGMLILWGPGPHMLRCISCGKLIAAKRLDVLPGAADCMACERRGPLNIEAAAA